MIDIDQKVYEWPFCPFTKVIPPWVNNFGKRTEWSLIYFLPSRKFWWSVSFYVQNISGLSLFKQFILVISKILLIQGWRSRILEPSLLWLRSLEYFFRRVGQNNFWNKIPVLLSYFLYMEINVACFSEIYCSDPSKNCYEVCWWVIIDNN